MLRGRQLGGALSRTPTRTHSGKEASSRSQMPGAWDWSLHTRTTPCAPQAAHPTAPGIFADHPPLILGPRFNPRAHVHLFFTTEKKKIQLSWLPDGKSKVPHRTARQKSGRSGERARRVATIKVRWVLTKDSDAVAPGLLWRTQDPKSNDELCRSSRGASHRRRLDTGGTGALAPSPAKRRARRGHKEAGPGSPQPRQCPSV